MIRDPFGHTNLSDQETSVLRLAAQGCTDREIARRMSVSEKTIDTYWSRIRQKLDARNRTHAVAIAYQEAMEDSQLDPLFGCEDILRNTAEGVWILDLYGRTVFANQKIAELFGYDLAEMEKLSGWDVLDEEGRSEARKFVEKYPDGRRESFRFRFKRKDGSDLNVIMTTSPILNEDGKPIRYLALLNEIPDEIAS